MEKLRMFKVSRLNFHGRMLLSARLNQALKKYFMHTCSFSVN